MLFTVAITLFCTVGSVILSYLFLPSGLSRQTYAPTLLTTMILTIPITYYVGIKILENHYLTLALEHAADHDGLTGTATRHSFYRQLKDTAEGPHTLIVVDIDHFKSINDQHGHDIGDKALKHFSRILRRNCRHDDIIARFGGEEFVILINQADLNAGLTAARRLCRVLPEAPLRVPGGVLTLTASFGVAELRTSNEVEKVIKRADMAVYRAKQDGRNRVLAYDPAMDIHPVG